MVSSFLCLLRVLEIRILISYWNCTLEFQSGENTIIMNYISIKWNTTFCFWPKWVESKTNYFCLEEMSNPQQLYLFDLLNLFTYMTKTCLRNNTFEKFITCLNSRMLIRRGYSIFRIYYNRRARRAETMIFVLHII